MIFASVAALAAIGLCAGVVLGQDAAPQALLLTGARVLDVVAGRYLDVAAVLVEGDRIAAIFKELPPDPLPKTRDVDVKGLTLVPGLGDMHAVAAPGEEADADYFYAMALAHGVTSYRVLGAPLPWAVSQRARIAAGAALAPRIWTSGPDVDGPPAFGFNLRSVADAAAASREARAQARARVDWISVRGGATEEMVRAILDEVGRAAPQPVARGASARQSQPRGARAGAARGSTPGSESQPVRVAVAAGLLPMLTLTRLGADSIEGLGIPTRTRAEYETALAGKPFPEGAPEAALAFIWERAPATDLKTLAASLARGRTTLVPLFASGFGLVRLTGLERDPALEFLPPSRRQRLLTGLGQAATPDTRERREKAFAAQARFIAQVVRAKGRVATGSDWNGAGYGIPGAAVHRELRLLVDAGLTPAEAIRAATVNGAALVGAAQTLGQIRIGYKADLIAVEGDPLARIEDLARIKLVIRGGESFTPASLLAQAKRAMRQRR